MTPPSVLAGESVQRHAAAIAAPHGNGNAVPERTEAATDKPSLPVMHLSSVAKPRAVPARDSAAPSSSSSTDNAAKRDSLAASPLKLATSPSSSPLPAQTHPSPLVSPLPPQPSVAAPTDSTPPATAKSDENAPPKDGVYYGWGTSRHGDIQASVEIKNGKIVGAYISQCLTQYSCSWISALPGQVLQRQSAEVDYVSGATQSSNAFYYAVIDALKKAK